MIDEENAQEIQPEFAEEAPVESTETTVPTEEAPKKSPDEIQANNFRAMRQKVAAAERERDEMARKIKDLETSPTKRNEPVDVDEDLELNIAPDDLAEGKHLSKVTKKIKQLENQIRSYQQNASTMTAEARLKAEHPDIELVVSLENIQTLRDMYPELAATLNSSQDLYTKGKAAYTMIKKFGIHSEDNYSQDREIAQRNIAKPKPLASVSPTQGESPISRANMFANGLTPELRAQLIKEMDDASKNI